MTDANDELEFWTADEVASKIPSRRRGSKVSAETIRRYSVIGYRVGGKTIKLKYTDGPGRRLYRRTDVLKFLDAISKAKGKTQRHGKESNFKRSG